MKDVIKRLKNICREYLFEEKIIVVDRASNGSRIIEDFIQEGENAIHLKALSVEQLVDRVSELVIKEPFKKIDRQIQTQILHLIIKSMGEQGKLEYFKNVELSYRLSEAINKTLQEIRLGGNTKESLQKARFTNVSKQQDLVQIWVEYEKFLEDNKIWDYAKQLKYILDSDFSFSKKTFFILQSNLDITYLEGQFLSRIQQVFKLPLQRVKGIDKVEQNLIRQIEWGEETKEQHNLETYIAKTEELEIKQVLMKIKNNNTKWDENIIYYTSKEPYNTILYHLATKLEIPVTYGEGIGLGYTRPGKLLQGLIRWSETNYSVQGFIDILNEKLLVIEGSLSNTKLIRMLRKLEIYWGKQRYITKLQERRHEIEIRCEQEEDEEKKTYYQQKLQEIKDAQRLFKGLFKRLPEYNQSNVNYQDMLKGFKEIIDKFSRTICLLDGEGKETLLQQMELLIPYANEELSYKEAMQKIRDVLLELNVHRSNEKAGALHITSYQEGCYGIRKQIYIVGMDNKNFPGNIKEDSLLLDIERSELGHDMTLYSEQSKENTYQMLQLMAQARGTVHVSYTNFDIAENRSKSASYLFLQCYRISQNQPEADFRTLQKCNVTLGNSQCLEEKDYWRERLLDKRECRLEEGFWKVFDHVKQGMSAVEQRKLGGVTEFEGNIESETKEYDPRHNKMKVISASQLELLGKCPYGYFVQEVLGLKENECGMPNKEEWLDAGELGSLVHSIFENFYNQIVEQDQLPIQAHHEQDLQEIAKRLIYRQREEKPVWSEHIFEKVKKQVQDTCKIFIKEEVASSIHTKPIHFEYKFGESIDSAPCIKLSDQQSILVKGFIDRIDQIGDKQYIILDYKTGSTWGYSQEAHFRGGRQLQHSLYTLAAETCGLGEENVVRAGYYFPTHKGNGQKYAYTQDQQVRSRCKELIGKLLDFIDQGNFVMTEDEKDCKYCKYTNICRRNLDYDNESMLVKGSDHIGIMNLRGVRTYE